MSAAVLRKMHAMGLTFEQAIDLFETMEASVANEQPVSSGAMRTRKWRERKSENVTGDVTVTRHGDADPLPLETKVSPRPLSKTQSLSPSKNPPKGGQKGSRRCPMAWIPGPSTLATLEGEGHLPGDLERALTRMRDHEFRTARSDWDATFRNWVRNDSDRKPKAHAKPHSDQRRDAYFDKLADISAAMESAVEQRRSSGGN